MRQGAERGGTEGRKACIHQGWRVMVGRQMAARGGRRKMCRDIRGDIQRDIQNSPENRSPGAVVRRQHGFIAEGEARKAAQGELDRLEKLLAES